MYNVTATIFFHLIPHPSVPIYDFHYYFIENEGSKGPHLLQSYFFVSWYPASRPSRGARRKRKSVREARRGWPGGEKKAGES